MKLKKPAKIGLVVVLGVCAFFGIRAFQNRSVKVEDLKTVGTVALPDAPEASLTGNAAVKLPLPGTKISSKGELLPIKWEMMIWQSQNNALLANGGVRTTEGSLFEQAGLDISIEVQNNCMLSMADMIKYCKDYKAGSTKEGLFVTYMGSGIPNYITSMQNQLKDLPTEYQPVAFLTFGKSYGEDKVIGSEDIRANKELLKGKILRGVKLDGDIDLALKLCADLDIKVNPNPKLYYADALNLSYVSADNGDFLTAVNDYNASLKETRKVVRNGQTGEDTTVQIDLVATWTPGDVNAKNGRGGVSIVSTKDYASIMPNITITSRKFLNDNREKMKGLVVALAQAGDQIRTFSEAKEYACTIGAKVWNQQDKAYWLKYYNGEGGLGGSMVFNMRDIAFVFGLDGSRDTYKDIYNTFGKLQSGYYHEDLPEFVAYEKAVDKSIMRDVYETHPELLEGKALKVDYSHTGGEVFGDKSWAVTFETGSAQITSTGMLDDIATQINTSDGLKAIIEGHTDNVGNADANKELSKRRAKAVVDYLILKGIESERFEVEGYGDEKPVADNSTAAGRAKNRRVQVILKK
jgi:OOP family OmpA-OmpF porin